MSLLLYDWPFCALVVAVVMLAWLALAPWPERGLRFRQPAWLSSLILPAYMLHQFEEHGYDLLGRRYHFIYEMCQQIGHPSLNGCAADPGFIFAVNCGAVWLTGLFGLVFRRRRPLIAACAFGLPLVNAIAHLAGAFVHRSYNSGVFTGTFLFLPLSVWAIFTFRRAGILGGLKPLLVAAVGVVGHLVLLGGVLAYAHGLLGRGVMLAVQVANGLWPLVGAVGGRMPIEGSPPQ